MSDNVIPMRGGAVSEEGRANMIDALEDALERVRSGEVLGLCMVLRHSDNAGSYLLTGSIGGFSMLGAAESMRSHLVDIVR